MGRHKRVKAFDPFFRGPKHNQKNANELNDPPGFNPVREKQKEKRMKTQRLSELKVERQQAEERAEAEKFVGLSRKERKLVHLESNKKAKKRIVSVSTDIGESRTSLIGGPNAEFVPMLAAVTDRAATTAMSKKKKKAARANKSKATTIVEDG